jgi:6-phosphogluconolactonase
VAPFSSVFTVSNSATFGILSVTELSNARQLVIFFQLVNSRYNIGYPSGSVSPFSTPSLVITQVNDTSNLITLSNISQYLTFIIRMRVNSPNLYTAVTVKMSGGLLYGASTLNFTSTLFGESFLQDNPTITQYITQPYANLNAVAPSTSYGLINASYVTQSSPIGANLFAYCVNFGANNINMYTINTLTGLLTNNSPSTLTIGNSPRNMIVSKDSRFVYATNSVDTNIQMMLLDMSTGLLTNNTTPTIAAGTNPSYLAIIPAYQNFLYVTNRGSNSVGGYLIDRTTGLLSPLSPATTTVGPAGSNPVGIAITNTASPSGIYVYIAANVNANIYMFQLSPGSGALTPLAPATIAKTGAYSLIIHPNGLYLYASSDNSSLITVYSINASTGQLTLVQNASSGNTTREMAITPNGAFLYALNNGANNIQQYSVSLSTGQLTSLGTVALTNPTSVKMSPNGLYLYVSSGTSNNVTIYGINQSTGLLTVAGSIAAGSNAFSVFIA